MVYRVLILCYANKGRSQGLCAFLEYFAAHDNRQNEFVFESAGVGEEEIRKLRKLGKIEQAQALSEFCGNGAFL